MCFNFVVLWRRNEDSRDLSPTREFEEKKDQAKNKTSLSHRNILKIEKTCFAHFLVFEREKLQYVFVSLTFSNFIQIFYQGHFNLLNWTLGSQVEIFNWKPEGNFESCSAVGDQKNLIFQNSFFYLMVKIFTRVQKIIWTSYIKF